MYVYKIVTVFLFIFVGQAKAEFYEETQKRWISTTQISLNTNYKTGTKISEPMGTFQVIAEFTIQNRNFDLIRDCLIYKIPSKKNTGELKLVSILYDQKCEDNILSPSTIMINKVFNFGIELKDNNLKLLVDTNNYEYRIYNLILPKQYKLDDSFESNTLEPGLFISFLNESGGKKLKDGDLCFDIDDKCEIVKSDLCHLCPGKVTEVIAGSCKTQYRKYCRNITCGGKGLPACIRGLKASGYENDYCIPGSPVGFCVKPYKVFCENKELICR